MACDDNGRDQGDGCDGKQGSLACRRIGGGLGSLHNVSSSILMVSEQADSTQLSMSGCGERRACCKRATPFSRFARSFILLPRKQRCSSRISADHLMGSSFESAVRRSMLSLKPGLSVTPPMPRMQLMIFTTFPNNWGDAEGTRARRMRTSSRGVGGSSQL